MFEKVEELGRVRLVKYSSQRLSFAFLFPSQYLETFLASLRRMQSVIMPAIKSEIQAVSQISCLHTYGLFMKLHKHLSTP